MIDERNAFDHSVKNDIRTREGFRKIFPGQKDDWLITLLSIFQGKL